MITRKYLCEQVLRQYAKNNMGMSIPFELTDIPVEKMCLSSSIAAVCMEYLGLLDNNPAMKDYASNRGGIVTCSINNDNEPVITTFRDILNSLPEE